MSSCLYCSIRMPLAAPSSLPKMEDRTNQDQHENEPFYIWTNQGYCSSHGGARIHVSLIDIKDLTLSLNQRGINSHQWIRFPFQTKLIINIGDSFCCLDFFCLKGQFGNEIAAMSFGVCYNSLLSHMFSTAHA